MIEQKELLVEMKKLVEITRKDFSEVTEISNDLPIWYKDGVDASLLAQTALNQQKFVSNLKNDEVYLTNKMDSILKQI